jgi:hypothetical protein
MSTRMVQLNRYFLLTLLTGSAWVAACSISYDLSSLSGGRQQAKAAEIVKAIREIDQLSPACEALAVGLVEAGLKANVAYWMPTSGRIAASKDEAAWLYELGSCPVKSMPVIAFAIAEHGNDLERERMKLRTERW